MKIKLDENMPRAMADMLRAEGYDVATVPGERLGGADDPPILSKATSEQRVLITFDKDFANIRAYPPGTHAGIVVFRLHDQRWAVLQRPAKGLIESGILERLGRGIAVVDEARIRLHGAGTRE